jgi:Zn-dependent metalloprotease
MSLRCNHVCYIIPPHILKEIAQNGSAAEKTQALETLTTTEQFRGHRQVLGPALASAAALFTGAVATVLYRNVYDAKHEEQLPGALVRKEGDPPSSDVAVNEAYDGAGATYDLYHKIYRRNSVDDRGLRLDSTVHYGQNYDNAFWNGQQMVYGDGDNSIFNRFTISIDVIGHELTHGVTQYEAGLVYSGQSGALNESFSDVFGSLVKQYKLGQTADKADWLIGQGLLTSKIKGVALRSMKAPGTAYNDPVLGKDPQPANMKNYVKTSSDNGGVHINSGMPNHAFYLVAPALGGNAWEKAGNIWYITLRDKLNSRANFQTAANATYHVAGELYGANSVEQKAVKDGWAGVGITVR